MKKTFRLDAGAARGPREVDDEIAFHLNMRTQEFVQQGLSPEAARAAALASFGDITAITAELQEVRRERNRERWWAGLVPATVSGLAAAGHALRRAPQFSLTVVITLALGVAATTASFSVLRGVVLRPLPFPEPERLVVIGHTAPMLNLGAVGGSRGTYFTYRRLTQSFEQIGAWTTSSATLLDPTATRPPERLAIGDISPSAFVTLRSTPLHGRVFNDTEGLPGAAPVILLSHEYWQRQFGGDPAIVGRVVQVNGRATEIIGVMPPTFRVPESGTQAWMPMVLNPAAIHGSGFGTTMVARLKDGVTLAGALADVQRAFQRYPELYPTLDDGIVTATVIAGSGMRPMVKGLHDEIVGDFRSLIWIASAAALLVLMVAGLNVTNLFVVRGEARRRELTLRSALGAARGRVVAHFLSETLLLAGVGTGVGVALAWGGIRMLRRFGPVELPRLTEITIDASTVLVAIGAGLLISVGATVLPAWRQGRVSLTQGLREGGRSGTASRGGQRLRGLMVTVQMALALVLLGASGLLFRSARALQSVAPGFDGSNVQTFRVMLPTAKYDETAPRVRFLEQLRTTLLAVPGVQEVGFTSRLPLSPDGFNLNPASAAEKSDASGVLPPLVSYVRANYSYFATMAIPLIAGQLFDAAPERQSPYEVIISRRVAREQWGDSLGTTALGRELRSATGALYRVIGVVGDIRDSSLTLPPSAVVYLPIAMGAETGPDGDNVGTGEMSFAIRTSNDPSLMAPAASRALASVDPSLPLFRYQSMAQFLERSYADVTFLLGILAVAAAVTLVLGAVGLYGVIAYVVALRRREFGVRLALGATPRSVSRLVARQGVVLGVTGVTAGLALLLPGARVLGALLHGVTPWDPLTLTVVVLCMLTIAALASWGPARRAAQLDPVDAIRSE